MRTQRVRSGNRRYSWRDRARDPALTAMLGVQCLIIFSEPLDTIGFETVSEAVQLLFFAITFIVYLIVRGPIATTLAISALIADLAGYVLDLVEPSKTSLNPWLCRTYYRLCHGVLRSRLCGAGPWCSNRSSGAGGDRPLFEYRVNVCHLIRIDLVLHSEFFHQYPERPTLAGRWHDRLFQLCHADIDRLWRCHAASPYRPHALQCGGHHRSIVSGDSAGSPNFGGIDSAPRSGPA